MSQRKTVFAIGEYYHIYNRGNSKQVVFHDTADYERFVSLLYIANSAKKFKVDRLSRQDLYIFDRGTPLVAIGAWTLMPNHFHILVTPSVENGVSKFMQKITTAYSMYYNQKYRRTGSLFEGKFKSTHVVDDRYLKYLYAYIHLNALKLVDSNWKHNLSKKIIQSIANYRYSSYQDYVSDKRLFRAIISPAAFPEFFGEAMEKDILEWVMYRQDLDS